MGRTDQDHPAQRLILVDGSGYIFRAYHALPPLTRKSDGLPVGAVAGFCNMLWKLINASETRLKPDYLAIIFDHSRASFRNQIYSQYKQNRPETPADLVPQFALIREATRAFNIAAIDMAGFEADDIIATYAQQATKQNIAVTIVSSDKDLMQLVNDEVVMYDSMKNRWITHDEVVGKFGVEPLQVIDVQALAGDSTDNVPGVPGIGIKTAAQLINDYGDLGNLLANAADITQNKRRENLINFADQARISRQLVELKCDVPLDLPVRELKQQDIDGSTLMSFLERMEFNTLTTRISKKLAIKTDNIATDKSFSARPGGQNEANETNGASETSHEKNGAVGQVDDNAWSPRMFADKMIVKAAASIIKPADYVTITDIDTLNSWLDLARTKRVIAIDSETDSLNSMRANLIGIAMAIEPAQTCYIPLRHKINDDSLGLEAGSQLKQIDFDQALAAIKPLLDDPAVLKVGHNIKYDLNVLIRCGLDPEPIADTMLMSYVLDGGIDAMHGLDNLALKWFNYQPMSYKEVVGGNTKNPFAMVDIAKATAYAGEDADITLRLYHLLQARMTAQGMHSVYNMLERPLLKVLATMERRGITIDRQALGKSSLQFASEMTTLATQIYEIAGEKFNIASTKQLAEIMFGKLEMPGGNKTKTGAWSTGATVLEELAGKGYRLARLVLDWRQLAKLKSTYTDSLPEHINPDTGRVHTSFSLAATATGRLSSSDPNVQNIPVRTALGRGIRKAFIAVAPKVLISADYNQIELRLLAEIADVATLKQAFADGLDIHAMTASEIFAIPIADINSEIRRQAKAINFGLIYGISAYGLANQLAISRGEAREYIDRYFARFPGIKDYMATTRALVHEQGYVETLFGRKVHYPNINTGNHAMRAFFERAAVNAVIQGSAADIIRRAMIKMPATLGDNGLDEVLMLLQVHDELIFETDRELAEKAIMVIKQTMENAPYPQLELGVKLRVDANYAANWDDAH